MQVQALMPRTESGVPKHPGKAGKKCHFHSAGQIPQLRLCGKKSLEGGEQDLAKTLCIICCIEKCLGGQSAGDGWTPRMDGDGQKQQLCGSLDKMLTVWNHIKGCDVEDSVCGLAQIQNVLGGFVVFKD